MDFAALYVVDSKAEGHIVAWAMAHRDSAERLWPTLTMSPPSLEAKAKEDGADLAKDMVAARIREAAKAPP